MTLDEYQPVQPSADELEIQDRYAHWKARVISREAAAALVVAEMLLRLVQAKEGGK